MVECLGVIDLNVLGKQILQAFIFGVILPGIMCSLAAHFHISGNALREPEDFQEYAPDHTESNAEIPVLHNGEITMMELETYIGSVLLGEVSASFDEEALKAQAVAARTYTLRCILGGDKHPQGAVCTDYRCCQAYRDSEEYLASGGTREGLNKIIRAVEETGGEVLYYGNDLICATYYASSGGRTEDAKEVWGQAYPYLVAVDSPGEEGCGYFWKTMTFESQEFQDALGVNLSGEPSDWFGIVTHTVGEGVDLIRIGGKLYTGVELRNKLGLRSTIFTVTTTDNTVTFETKGYGHRVGMSQHGANAMAQDGSDYREILGHYYPGTTLSPYLSDSD